MKKLLCAFIALFALQTGFAQSPEAKNYVKNAGITDQFVEIKNGILPNILEENVADFNKEYEAVVADYISGLETLVDESFSQEDLKKFNESAAKGTPEAIAPKDIPSFQQKAGSLEESLGLAINGIIIKHADPAILEQIQ